MHGHATHSEQREAQGLRNRGKRMQALSTAIPDECTKPTLWPSWTHGFSSTENPSASTADGTLRGLDEHEQEMI